MPIVVRLRSAVCLLGRFPALAGVDLDVGAGETVLLSGPNGAGKTTLLRVLAGLVPLYSGTAEVLGHDLRRERRGVRRHLALVGHETFCYDELTVRENVAFAAGALGRPASTVDHALERLDLTEIAGVAHGRLSQGQRRRLSFAVALVRDPELLLLDEPHAGLDAAGREVIDAVLRDAPGEGRAALIVSHELERARALVQREVVLAAGQAHGVLDPGPGSVPALPAAVVSP